MTSTHPYFLVYNGQRYECRMTPTSLVVAFNGEEIAAYRFRTTSMQAHMRAIYAGDGAPWAFRGEFEYKLLSDGSAKVLERIQQSKGGKE